MVKYIESVFHLSSSLSSTLTGSIVVPAAVFGTFTGGYLVRRFHMGILQCVKMILIACLLSWLGLVALLFLKCQSTSLYQGDTSCSKACHCSPHVYEPICYQEEITYLSPCHAGCLFINGTVTTIFFFFACFIEIDLSSPPRITPTAHVYRTVTPSEPARVKTFA